MEICSMIIDNVRDINYCENHKKNTRKIMGNIKKSYFTIDENLYYYFNSSELKKMETTLCEKCGNFRTCCDGASWRAFCFCDMPDLLPNLGELAAFE